MFIISEITLRVSKFAIRHLAAQTCLALVAALVCGCSLFHNSPAEITAASPASPAMASTNHHGYALLYNLVGDEKDLSKLRFIKHERPELKSLLQEIARVNRDAYAQLEKLGKETTIVNLKDQGLPPAEVATRKAISNFKEKAILSEKDKDLEIELLLSQNEALTYGAHLAGVVAGSETDPHRQEILRQISATLGELQKKVFQMLTKNYSWTEGK